MQNVDYCFEAFSVARAADQGESGGLAVAGQRQQGRTPRLTPGGETDIPPAGYPAERRLFLNCVGYPADVILVHFLHTIKKKF